MSSNFRLDNRMIIEDGGGRQRKTRSTAWLLGLAAVILVAIIIGTVLLVVLLKDSGQNENKIELSSGNQSNSMLLIEILYVEQAKKAISQVTKSGKERAFNQLIKPGWKKEVDPCSDFYEYTCGNFKENSVWIRSYLTTLGLMTESGNNLLTQDVTSLTDSKPLQNVYQQVKNLWNAKFPEGDQRMEQIGKLVQDLGGSPLIYGYNRTRNIFKTMVQLQKLAGLQPFIDFKKIKDLLDPNKSALSILINVQFLEKVIGLTLVDNFPATRHFATENKFNETAASRLQKYTIELVSKMKENKTLLWESDQLREIQMKREKETHLTSEQIKKMNPQLEESLLELFKNDSSKMKKTKIYAFYTLPTTELKLPLSQKGFRDFLTVENNVDVDLAQAVLVETALKYLLNPKKFSYKEKVLKSSMMLPFLNLVANEIDHLKDKTDEIDFMIKTLRDTFRHRINESKWMSQDGKRKAIEKLNHIKKRIFIPEILENKTEFANYYKDFPKSKENQGFMDLVELMATFELEQQFKDLDRPTKYEPLLSGETAFKPNAMYDPTGNSINILLGIIQEPIIDLEYPLMMKFAGLGTVIGHELSHGFDINGQNFDLHGTLRPWMPENDFSIFQTRAHCFVEEYNKFCLTDAKKVEKCVDGSNSQGETMADDGGIRLAHTAYKSISAKFPELAAQDKLAELGSLNQDQQFFLGYASLWCDRERLPPPTDDPHPPGWARIQGTLKNYPPFSEAFQCKLGTEMNPEEKCQVW